MGEIVKDEETSELRYEKKIDHNMFLQDLRDLSIIQLLQRAREREDLTDEVARKLDDLEKRVENGEPIPEEEMHLFWEAVRGMGPENTHRGDILRKKMDAYYSEQGSIQTERILSGEERTTLAYAEKALIDELAVANGSPDAIERIERGLSAIQRVKQNLREPQVLEKRPQITPEERDAVYERIAEYENKRIEEVNEYVEEHKEIISAGMEQYEKKSEEGPSTEDNVGVEETQPSVENDEPTPFSTEDLELTTSDVTRSEIVDAYTDVKRTVGREEREEERRGSNQEIDE